MFGTNQLCEFVRQFSPITAQSVSKVHQLIDMVATHDFYPMDPRIWMPIIAFSRVVVKWNFIFLSLLFFSYETFKNFKKWVNEMN